MAKVKGKDDVKFSNHYYFREEMKKNKKKPKKHRPRILENKICYNRDSKFNSAHQEENTLRRAGRTLKTRATYLNNAFPVQSTRSSSQIHLAPEVQS